MELPGWAPPVVYGVVTLILFRDFVLSGEMLMGTDTLALGYMARAFFADALRELGTFPLWNPLLFGGTPFLESLAGGDSLHPISVLLLFLMDTHRALGWKLVVHVFLAGVFMYGWIRALGLSKGAAFLAGLAYLLAPYMVTLVYPGHDGKLFVTAMTPLLFWMAERGLGERSLLAYVGMAVGIALVILSTHFQMAYFLFGALGAFAVFRTAQIARDGEAGWPPAVRRFSLFLGFSVLGAGVSAVQLVPAYDYVVEHSRRAAHTAEVEGGDGIAWSSSWSLHPEEVVSLVVPEFVGNNAGGASWASETYWGRNVFKLNHEYLGLVALLLASVAFLGGARPGLRWFFTGMGAVVALYTLGTHTPVWRLFYEVVPGIQLFRAPSMAIFLPGFAVSTLMAFGVDRAREVLRKGDEATGRRIQTLLWGAAGVFGLGVLLSGMGVLPELWSQLVRGPMEPHEMEALERARPFITQGFLWAAGLAGAGGAVWWSLRRGYIPPAAALAVVALLVAVDQGRVNDAFIQLQSYQEFATPDANHRFLQERWDAEGPFRVFSMAQGGEDVRPAMFGVELAAGHHPNDLGRYRELIGMEGGGIPEHLAGFNPNVLRTLNVRYILWPDLQFGPLEGVEPVSQVSLPDGRVFSSVYEYPALPRAWLVGEATVIEDDREALDHLLSSGFDPGRTALLSRPPPNDLGGESVDGEVAWLERGYNAQRLEVEAAQPALLMISENWLPAWSAKVNGEEAPILRANHALRAVPVPAGSSVVEVRYRSALLFWSLMLTILSVLVLVAVVVIARLRPGWVPSRPPGS